MTAWRSTERALFCLGLEKEKTLKLKTESVSVCMTEFRLPHGGTDFFRRLETGCWYSGMPSTGPAHRLLRETGWADKSGVFRLPVLEESLGPGYWAIEAAVPKPGRLRRIRLWWIDLVAPRAIRVVGFFCSEVPLNLKPC